MNLSEEKIKETEQNLKTGLLIGLDEKIEVIDKGDYWEKFIIFNNQVRGYYYYTTKHIVFIGGAFGSTMWSVPYESIKSIKRSNVSLFIPTGIKIEFFDEKKNRLKKYKMSVLKREKWIKFIEDKMNK